MTLPAPVPTSAQHALRLAGLIAVLAGLFGMHGLNGHSSDHGPAAMRTHTAAPAMAAMPAMPAVASLGMGASVFAALPTGIVSDAALSAGTHAEGLLQASTGTGHDTDSGGIAMGAMCLAILGAALLALLQLLRRAWVAPVVWTLPRPARAITPRSRDPDPPSLIKLSIQRC